MMKFLKYWLYFRRLEQKQFLERTMKCTAKNSTIHVCGSMLIIFHANNGAQAEHPASFPQFDPAQLISDSLARHSVIDAEGWKIRRQTWQWRQGQSVASLHPGQGTPQYDLVTARTQLYSTPHSKENSTLCDPGSTSYLKRCSIKIVFQAAAVCRM